MKSSVVIKLLAVFDQLVMQCTELQDVTLTPCTYAPKAL